MRILLINVPHAAIGSRIPDDRLPPLGLLAVTPIKLPSARQSAHPVAPARPSEN